MTDILRLKKRCEFVQAAKQGKIVRMPAVILQAYILPISETIQHPKVGLTVTKKVGNAVIRNAIRRKFKEIIRLQVSDQLKTAINYVFIVRSAALDLSFTDLSYQIHKALKKMAHELAVTLPMKI